MHFSQLKIEKKNLVYVDICSLKMEGSDLIIGGPDS